VERADGIGLAMVARRDITAIAKGTFNDPFSVLGVHPDGKGFVARAFVPGADSVTAETLAGQPVGTLEKKDEAGFFEGTVHLPARQPLRYRAKNKLGEWIVADAYSFGPVLGPMDDYYMAQGSHLRLFDKLGAHQIEHEGATGFHFAVWAPNAKRVSVVGDFNEWDGRRHVMRHRAD
jgi:1,4-alpha-glucan branching enzyme